MEPRRGEHISIRKAHRADARVIKALIRDARLNPLGIDWRRFVVAEAHGQVVGAGQIKPHGDGSWELASLVVSPEHRAEGVGSRIMHTLLADGPEPLYLLCEQPLETFYRRFGFRRLGPSELPPYFRRIMRVTRPFQLVSRLVVPGGVQILVMRRP